MSKQKQTTTHKHIPKNLEGKIPPRDMMSVIPYDLMCDFEAFVVGKKGKCFIVATMKPENEALHRYVTRHLGEESIIVRTTPEHISLALHKYVPDFQLEVKNTAEANVLDNGNISKLVDYIIRHAIEEKVSDVHIEPRRDEGMVRFRVDGILHTKHTLTMDVYQAMVARLKVMANLKIDEYRRPQDGRIELVDMRDTSLRISTVPTLFGEKVVFRILNETAGELCVEDLGFTPKQKEILMRNVDKPFGMIVASGPTGSGKTTSLYALLRLLKQGGINISTLEDPIEGMLEGVNQIQTNSDVGLTFASGLRALLRQDPDVIMVGEIRDSETAIMSANAAMTGHLVFSTMHTNDAASAFVRFLEMKVGDFVVASTVNLVIAQRLVRKVCSSCVVEEVLDSRVLKKIEEREDVVKILRDGNFKIIDELKTKKFRKGMGCGACFDTGYVGRVGLYELIEPNKEVQSLILEHAPAERIKCAAQKIPGFSEMLEDGIQKIIEGKTTFDEVLHVTRSGS